MIDYSQKSRNWKFWLDNIFVSENFRFRHFATSALISAGLDVTTVSGALEHSDSGTALNVYSHMFQTTQARVAETIDDVFSFLPTTDIQIKTALSAAKIMNSGQVADKAIFRQK